MTCSGGLAMTRITVAGVRDNELGGIRWRLAALTVMGLARMERTPIEASPTQTDSLHRWRRKARFRTPIEIPGLWRDECHCMY